MKNIKPMKLLINAVVFIVVWTLLDWIISLFSGKTFAFSLVSNIVSPGVTGVFCGLLETLWEKKK